MPPETPKEKEEHVPIKALRTYQGDVEEALQKNKYSATTILVAEQERKERAPRMLEPVNTEGWNKLFIILGFILLFVGVIAVAGVYYFKSNQKVVIDKTTRALIAFSVEKTFSVASSTREQLFSKIVSEKQTLKSPVNSVLYLNTTASDNTPENIGKILELLAPRMPASLSRAFENEYMVGIYSYDINAPFIILTTKDFGSSYSGMLKWEKDIVTDLGKIFEIPINFGGVTGFTDKALRNKDLRVLVDSNNKTLLLYSFIDKNTLVITKNEDIFNAILAKYLVGKNVR